MTHIIISYRRADSDAMAGRIKDLLASHFGEGSIFMDIDSIPFGFDFRDHIQEALANNDILVAIIGPKWSGQGKGGGTRIMDEADPVRIEIETALKNGSAVIPVLVGGATMPDAAELPDSLKNLAFRNAAEVDAGRDFHQHMDRLIRSMDFILAKKGKTAAAAPPTFSVDKPVEAAPIAPSVAAPRVAPAAVPIQHAAAAVMSTTTASAPAQKSRGTMIAAAALVLVLLGAGGGAWIYMKPKPPEPKIVEQPKTPTVLQSGGAATVATGCKLDVPIALADDFKTADAAWNLPTQTAYYADGQLVLNGQEGRIAHLLYAPFHFKNVTICAQVKSPAKIGAPDGELDGGVTFWATDTSNYYFASLYPNGTYSIYRVANNSAVKVVPRAPFAGINRGPDAVNEIQVSTKDAVGTLYINGTKVQEFRGQPPKDPGSVGLYSSSNDNERNEWRFISLVVGDPDRPAQQRRVQAPPAAQVVTGCKPSRTAAFEDKFKTVDPGWGVAANTPAAYVDGELALKPVADKAWEQLYPSLFFRSATLCSRVRSPAQVTDAGDAYGGLVFWGTSKSNFYTATVFPNGRIGVYRKFNDQWAKVLPAVASSAVKQGSGVVNELMISYGGDMAAFIVNGQKVFEFRGQPPLNGGSIGLHASSEAAKENEWRFLDVVVVEND